MIEKYIQFAIDNGFDVKEYCITSNNVKNWAKKWFEATATVSDVEMITSLKFIEAIARGLVKDNTNISDLLWKYFKIQHYGCTELNFIDRLTEKQAIAIRDNKLEEFITKLLWDQ